MPNDSPVIRFGAFRLLPAQRQLMRALGIPKNMFTVMFAIGRMPGWIAQWREVAQNPKLKIYRPRQIYVGHAERAFVPLQKRG